jgi:hypothetical protein
VHFVSQAANLFYPNLKTGPWTVPTINSIQILGTDPLFSEIENAEFHNFLYE